MIRITSELQIPETELALSASRSGGPGGQNVNKVSTRVMLRFDVERSPSLTEEQRACILARLRNRITRDGVLVLAAQEHRTQPANRAAVLERFATLLAAALRRQTPRRPTKTTAGARRRRIESKLRRSRSKRLRAKNIPLEQ